MDDTYRHCHADRGDQSPPDHHVLRTYRFGKDKHDQAGWMSVGGTMWDGPGRTNSLGTVAPSISKFCTTINDLLPDDCRTQVIDDFGTWLPFGTAGSPRDDRSRVQHLVQSAVKIWAGDTAEITGSGDYAAHLRALPNLERDIPIANCYFSLLCAGYSAAFHESSGLYKLQRLPPTLAGSAVRAARMAALAFSSLDCNDACTLAIDAATWAVRAHAPNEQQYIETKLLPVLRELIDMGPRCPREL